MVINNNDIRQLVYHRHHNNQAITIHNSKHLLLLHKHNIHSGHSSNSIENHGMDLSSSSLAKHQRQQHQAQSAAAARLLLPPLVLLLSNNPY